MVNICKYTLHWSYGYDEIGWLKSASRIREFCVCFFSDMLASGQKATYTPWQLRPNKDLKKCPKNYTKTFHTAVRPIPLQTKTGTCGPINGPPQPSAMPAGKLCRGGSINPQIKGCIYSWSSWLILTNPILENCIDCAVFTWLGTANRMRQCFMILSNFNISRGPKSVIPFW